MTFAYTWNATFEAAPPNSEAFYMGASRIRDFKLASRERFSADHYFSLTGGDEQGEHTKLTLREGSAPTKAASKGFIYAKDVSGASELFYMDSDGNETQITAGGIVGVDVPAGTKMLFYQDVAPTGWTLVNVDDKVAFITKGSAASGQTGGGAHSEGTWTSTVHTHTTTHGHDYISIHKNWTEGSGGASGYISIGGVEKCTYSSLYVGSEWGENPASGESGTANTWRPDSYCFVIASKD